MKNNNTTWEELKAYLLANGWEEDSNTEVKKQGRVLCREDRIFYINRTLPLWGEIPPLPLFDTIDEINAFAKELIIPLPERDIKVGDKVYFKKYPSEIYTIDTVKKVNKKTFRTEGGSTFYKTLRNGLYMGYTSNIWRSYKGKLLTKLAKQQLAESAQKRELVQWYKNFSPTIDQIRAFRELVRNKNTNT